MLKSTVFSFTEAGYGAHLCAGVKEVGIHLRSLIHTRRIKSAKILNSWVLMGLAGSDSNNPQDVALGTRPGPPNATAYTKRLQLIKMLTPVSAEDRESYHLFSEN